MLEKADPLVSVIIVNWNGAQHLYRCLDALRQQTFRDFETIVVDNASTDGSVDCLNTDYPEIRLYHLERNSGFAAGNNIGVQYASGKWLALLNNDAFPKSDWLENLLFAVKQHPGAAAFASRVVDARDPDLIDGTGQIVHISGLTWDRDHGIRVEDISRSSENIFSACAAAALYDREAFIKVGGFDERFENYYEDVDLGARLQALGYPCIYASEAEVAHVGSYSFGVESNRSVYYQQRNWVWFYVKNMPSFYVWLFAPVHIFMMFILYFRYLVRGQGKIYLQAKKDSILSWRIILNERKKIQQGSRANPDKLIGMMNKNFLSPFLLGKFRRKYALSDW